MKAQYNIIGLKISKITVIQRMNVNYKTVLDYSSLKETTHKIYIFRNSHCIEYDYKSIPTDRIYLNNKYKFCSS